MDNQTVKNRLIKTTTVNKDYSNLTKMLLNMRIRIWSETKSLLKCIWCIKNNKNISFIFLGGNQKISATSR